MSATFLSSLPITLELLLTPSVPASVNSAISAASALIPFPSSDFQLLTFNFQPSNLQTFKRPRASSFALISFAAPHHSFKFFICNTYKKHGGGAAIMVNQALETSRPTSSHALCLRASVVSSAFRLPYTLPSSVSRNPFVCHSYENCRGVYQQFPFWNVLSDWRHYLAVSLTFYFLASLRPYFFTSRPSLFRQTIAARFPARWLLSGRSPCQ